MHDLKLSIDTNPKTSDVDALRRGLTEHALPITQSEGFAPLAVFAHDAKGALVGGVHGPSTFLFAQSAPGRSRRIAIGSQRLSATDHDPSRIGLAFQK